MKAAFVTPYYKYNVPRIEALHPDLYTLPYAEQKRIIDGYNYWPMGWHNAMTRRGYDMLTLPINAERHIMAWGKENGYASEDPEAQVVEQVRRFQPEILFYNHHHGRLLRRIREVCPKLKLAFTFAGSPIYDLDIFKGVAFVVSCAQDLLDEYARMGVPGYLIHHAFDPAILPRLKDGPMIDEFAFIGSILRLKTYHREREEFLEILTQRTPLTLYSPSYLFGMKDDLKTLFKQLVYLGLVPLRQIPLVVKLLKSNRKLEKVLTLTDFPKFPVSSILRPKLRPPVYADEMFQTLRQAAVTLNFHADFSPNHASNMRLFEAPGAGSCLLTDWKPNLPELFEPDVECVTYRSTEECIEKVRRLLDHPAERQRIAAAGHARVLRDHTFDHRAAQLDAAIRRHL